MQPAGAYLDDTELHLTPIEFKLLSLLSKNVGKVLTHKFITENIWGSSWDNDVGSLRVFMATLQAILLFISYIHNCDNFIFFIK